MAAETLAALATTGANTLVGAMATDAWQAAKGGVVRLFRRSGGEQQAAIEEQLSRNAIRVEQAQDANSARQRLAPSWQLELESLLAEDPDAAEELTALIAEIQKQLPPAEQVWVQTNIARDQGTLFAVQGGNMVVHQTASPDPSPAPAPDQSTGDSR
jgi:hypothetical protein